MAKRTKETNGADPVRQLPNGKWKHPLDANTFDDETNCRADYRFALDWQRSTLGND